MATWKHLMAADKATSWEPGQLIDINLPDRGIEGTFLVQRVTITRIANLWQYRIDYGGRLFGIADFLKALVSAQQKKRNISPAQNVQKYVGSEEGLGLTDELLTTTRSLPYICGDPDAICGMVVVSSG